MSPENLKALYQKHVRRIYRFFYSRTSSIEISEDLTSEVFISFAESCRKNTTEIANHDAYIYGIAKNVFTTYLRGKYGHQDIPLDIENLDHQGFMDYVQTDEEARNASKNELTTENKVRHYINMLPEAQRTVMDLRLIKKLSLSEICKELDKDMNYVKTTQKRGIKKLKELLECTPPPTNILKEDQYAQR